MPQKPQLKCFSNNISEKKDQYYFKISTFINLKAAMSVSYFYSIPSHTDKVILKVKYLKHFTVLFLLTAAQYAF